MIDEGLDVARSWKSWLGCCGFSGDVVEIRETPDSQTTLVSFQEGAD